MARPRIEVDRKQVEKLCYIQCTKAEIAGFLGISEDTLERRIKEWDFVGFAAFYKNYSQGGKISLRRWQYKAAEKGNVTMLIWLGKQYLGQRDDPGFDDDDEEYKIPESLDKN